MASELKSINDCKPCKRRLPVTEREKNAGLITGLLLALLPKCPFCLVAYSSTVVLCGKGGTQLTNHPVSSGATFYLSLFLCLVILLSILLNNRKDPRTSYAFLLALCGSACILFAVTRGGGIFLYYLGVITVFCAVWLNGSLLFFISRISVYMKNRPAAIHQ